MMCVEPHLLGGQGGRLPPRTFLFSVVASGTPKLATGYDVNFKILRGGDPPPPALCTKPCLVASGLPCNKRVKQGRPGNMARRDRSIFVYVGVYLCGHVLVSVMMYM